MYRLCPFFYFTDDTRIKYKWGSAAAWKCISKTNKSLGALSSCLPTESILWACGAGKAHETFCGALLALKVFCEATLALVLFSLGAPPLSLFPGVCQGVSPVCNSCSEMIAHLRIALTHGSMSSTLLSESLWNGCSKLSSAVLYDLVYKWGLVFLLIFCKLQNMILPSSKTGWSRLIPHLIQANTWSTIKAQIGLIVLKWSGLVELVVPLQGGLLVWKGVMVFQHMQSYLLRLLPCSKRYSRWCADNLFFVYLIIWIGPQVPEYNSQFFDLMWILDIQISAEEDFNTKSVIEKYCLVCWDCYFKMDYKSSFNVEEG